MAWMLLGIGVTLIIVGVTTANIIAEIIYWGYEGWLNSLFSLTCWTLIGYPGAYLTFTHITGVGL